MRTLAACTIGVFGSLAGAAWGQLTPERTYYGLGRAMPMMVTPVPAGAESPDGVRLFGAPDGAEIDRATCTPGTIDLTTVFPRLWNDEPARVVYAQAYRGEEPVGPAVVLQPMVTPAYAPRVDRDGAPAFAAPTGRSRVFSGYRAYVDKYIVLETSKGSVTIALHPEAAPNTAWTVRELAAGGFYTDVLVHRIASLGAQAEADVIQFGDPSVTLPPASESEATAGKNAESRRNERAPTAGFGGAGFMIDLEPSTLPHDFGVLSMARGSDPNSASSQIVIALNRSRCAALDGRYAAFAEVVDGAETLLALARTPVDADYRAIEPPVIRTARLVDAPPFPQRRARVVDPGTRPVER